VPAADALVLLALMPDAAVAASPVAASLAAGCLLTRATLGLALRIVSGAAARARRLEASRP
jgi:hypothetical protein